MEAIWKGGFETMIDREDMMELTRRMTVSVIQSVSKKSA